MKISPGLCSLTAASLLGACSGGGSAVSSVGTSSPPAGVECTGNCANAGTYLTAADVEQIIAQGVAEASARHVDATIAVVDRVGNVLAVYRMGTANARSVVIGSEFDGAGAAVLHSGLEGLMLPVPPALAGVNLDQEAAIAKAITGAYLSSEGNAFSTRTASQIIQEHFNPGVQDQPSGPLFGVQFSQLACSDFILRNPKGAGAIQGPQRSPLGLAADPGGFPLYKAGTVVGGVGVLSDGIYSLDKNITDIVVGSDEAVAYAATYGYAAPADRRADQITVNGLTLRFSDVQEGDLSSDPSAASPSSLPSSGAFLAVPGYGDGKVHAGVAFGQPQSGIRADGGQFFPASLDAYLFVDPQNLNRYPPKAGTDGYLTQPQVQQLLISALEVASETRAQIRIPAGQSASVTIAVVDTNGAILGMVRTQDAPVFGADVSLQKARSAVFLSSPDAGPFLSALPPAQYIATLPAGLTPNTQIPLSQYVAGAEGFLGNPQVLDGTIAWSDRAIGDLSRPYFPDGIDGAPNGPLSKPEGQWSIFSTGLQLDLSINAILQHVIYVATNSGPDVDTGCAGVSDVFVGHSPQFKSTLPNNARLANGLQIFPGSVPIYRGSTLIGGIGVSGDGVDQDDMIAFLGLEHAAMALNNAIGEAAAGRRADTLTPKGTRLLYVQCPQSPFLDSDQEDVCSGY